jgi:tRNA pseudouridine55 synthase
MIINLYKKRGETPLQAIERLKSTYLESGGTADGELKIDELGDLSNAPVTYLGRLDPMADGVLLVGVDNDAQQEARQKYMSLDKEYSFEVLFGFATDTYDCLGVVEAEDKEIPQIASDENLKEEYEMRVRKVSQIYIGERMQKYPKFSSKVLANFDIESVRGGKVSEEDIPESRIIIYDIKFSGLETVSAKEIFGRLLSDIGKVKGDFRQIKILGEWKERLVTRDPQQTYLLGKFHAHVSSGTYIRSLVNDIASTLGTKALALSITRTKQGDFDIKDSIRF